MNRRNFFAASAAVATSMLSGCVAFVKHGKTGHILRVPKQTPIGAVITMIKTDENHWVFLNVPPGTRIE